MAYCSTKRLCAGHGAGAHLCGSQKTLEVRKGDCPSNEELALRGQAGDKNAAELLISQNEGYITDLALKHIEWCDLEDLKQEGALALMEAAKRFDPAYGTKLLTYATPAIESAMMDYGADHQYLAQPVPSASQGGLCLRRGAG